MDSAQPHDRHLPLVICPADPLFLHQHSEQIRQYHCATLEKLFYIGKLIDLVDELTRE